MMRRVLKCSQRGRLGDIMSLRQVNLKVFGDRGKFRRQKITIISIRRLNLRDICTRGLDHERYNLVQRQDSSFPGPVQSVFTHVHDLNFFSAW
jgi:hypothetical protein